MFRERHAAFQAELQRRQVVKGELARLDIGGDDFRIVDVEDRRRRDRSGGRQRGEPLGLRAEAVAGGAGFPECGLAFEGGSLVIHGGGSGDCRGALLMLMG